MCAIWPVRLTQDESSPGRSPVPRPEADEFGDWQVDIMSGARIDPSLLPIGHPIPAPEGLCRLDLADRDDLPGLSGEQRPGTLLTAWFASITQLPAVLNVTVLLPRLSTPANSPD